MICRYYTPSPGLGAHGRAPLQSSSAAISLFPQFNPEMLSIDPGTLQAVDSIVLELVMVHIASFLDLIRK